MVTGGRMLRRPAAVSGRHTRTETAGRTASLVHRAAAAPARVQAERLAKPVGAQIGRRGALMSAQVGRITVPARRTFRPVVAA